MKQRFALHVSRWENLFSWWAGEISLLWPIQHVTHTRSRVPTFHIIQTMGPICPKLLSITKCYSEPEGVKIWSPRQDSSKGGKRNFGCGPHSNGQNVDFLEAPIPKSSETLKAAKIPTLPFHWLLACVIWLVPFLTFWSLLLSKVQDYPYEM